MKLTVSLPVNQTPMRDWHWHFLPALQRNEKGVPLASFEV
jgi:hypothetical protein